MDGLLAFDIVCSMIDASDNCFWKYEVVCGSLIFDYPYEKLLLCSYEGGLNEEKCSSISG